MEVQLAVKKTVRAGGSPPHHLGGDTAAKAVIIPNYLKPSTGSCHHVCKYGGAHTFQDNNKDAHKQNKPKARTKQQPPPLPARGPADHQAKTRNTPPPLISRARMRLFGRGGGVRVQEEAAVVVVVSNNEQQQRKAPPAGDGDESGVEWKDIVAYVDTAPDQPDDAKSHQKESPVVKPPVSSTAMVPKHKTVVTGTKAPAEPSTHHHKDMMSAHGSKGGVKPPPRGGSRKKPAVSKKKAIVADQVADLVGGGDAYQYQPLSPTLLRERANLVRDLEEEMKMTAREAPTTTTTDVADEFNKVATCYSLECDAAAAGETETGSRRPVPAHRRVKSTSVVLSNGSGRSVVRFPFTRQGSKNGSSFKLRSKSSRAPITLPSQEEENPAAGRRSRSRRGSSMGGGDDVPGSTSTGGRGVQLRIRSLRRRGLGGGGPAGAGGFVVPAVSLRHQKTLEKKRSQRLYNSVIEETASRLAKTRKSRVKALVGAFESVISRIAK